MAATNGRIRLSLEGIESALARSKTGDREAYLESLRKRVAIYERRYKLPSDVLREALRSHKVREDLDVVKWLHAHDTLVDLEDEARVEQVGQLPSRSGARGRR